jgi:hypothetical protein
VVNLSEDGVETSQAAEARLHRDFGYGEIGPIQ